MSSDDTPPPAPADGAGLDLDAVQARANAATPGPWQWADDGARLIVANLDVPHPVVARITSETRQIPIDDEDRANGAFIAAARSDVPALVAAVRSRDAEVARLSARVPRRPFDVRCADALADEVAALVRRGVIDSRSPAADALLDYRDPPSTPRADRLAAVEAELSLRVEASRRARGLADPEHDLRDALAALPEGDVKAQGRDALDALGQRLAAVEAERDALAERLAMARSFTTPDGWHIEPSGSAWIVSRPVADATAQVLRHRCLRADGTEGEEGSVFSTAGEAFAALHKAREGSR